MLQPSSLQVLFIFLTDGRLYYVGPNKTYMRLVVMTEEEKRFALSECHGNTETGIHHGVRSTRNRVIAGYYWPTLIKDVTEWVRPESSLFTQQNSSVYSHGGSGDLADPVRLPVKPLTQFKLEEKCL